MARPCNHNDVLSVTAYPGDAKTLLAFDMVEAATKDLAGFSIECRPGDRQAYYLLNNLAFEDPSVHAQVQGEPAESSVNAPFHRFRWLHVLGQNHQGLTPFNGPYTCTVTPRYFDSSKHLLALDATQSVSLQVDVQAFDKGCVQVGFTRGFTQSQAFVRHFGEKAPLRPDVPGLTYATDQVAGSVQGRTFTFEDEYRWSGFTAREKLYGLLERVQEEDGLALDVFAYDLDETGIVEKLLDLAQKGRVRVILDDAPLHHSDKKVQPEDTFATEFAAKATGKAALIRGHFGRYAHSKVFVIHDGDGPCTVLAGSTNFSLTGLYVNSNHVLVFENRDIAAAYGRVFDNTWDNHVSRAKFAHSDSSTLGFVCGDGFSPTTKVTFSPHEEDPAKAVLANIVDRIDAEKALGDGGSVLFAVMALEGTGQVYSTLAALHEDQSIFSAGISDNPDGIYLYKPGHKDGMHVSGTPASTVLPPPFSQVPGVDMGHQVHHKFVVCGLNRPDATVFCGSSNLSLGGEKDNGDNLLRIDDEDVATAFALEAMGLIDHFNFLDGMTTQGKGETAKATGAPPKPVANITAAAKKHEWFLSVGDGWMKPYYDPEDLKYADRVLFGRPD